MKKSDEKESWFKRHIGLLLLPLLLVLSVGTIFGMKSLSVTDAEKDSQKILEELDKKAPAITQQKFEDLPVGLIYEYSEEEKTKFMEMAKDPEFDPGRFFQETVELTIAEDGSLRRPEGFIGKIETNLDGKGEHEMEDMTENLKADQSDPGRFDTNNLDVDKYVNTILYYEEYWKNDNHFNMNYKNWDSVVEDVFYGLYEDQYGDGLLRPAIASGFFKTDIKGNHIPFEFMFFGPLVSNPYSMLELASDVQPEYPSVNINGLSSKLEKYNEADKYSGIVTTYYIPSRVWKMNDNHIIVDVELENGSMLSTLDINRLVGKINYANAPVEENVDPEGQKFVLHPGSYDPEKDFTVSARYFDSDITQGIRPDFGMSMANQYQDYYASFNTGHLRKDLALNNQAKGLLRDYYGEVKECIKNGKTISTINILNDLSSKHNISYKDAVNIWAVDYMQDMTHAMSLDEYLKEDIYNELHKDD